MLLTIHVKFITLSKNHSAQKAQSSIITLKILCSIYVSLMPVVLICNYTESLMSGSAWGICFSIARNAKPLDADFHFHPNALNFILAPTKNGQLTN